MDLGHRPWIEPPPEARRLAAGANASGFEWHDDLGHWCLLDPVTSGAPQTSNGEQTRLVLERMEALLGRVGVAFSDVIRTWYLLDDILGWYDEFNRVRTRFFEQQGLLERLPASTAIGRALGGRSAVVGSLVALRPESELVTVRPVPSPLQGSAVDYGSSFSRAMQISWPRGWRLYVSGTASIDSTGLTLHAGETRAQAEEAFRILGELLDSRGLEFADVTRATCYLARPEDIGPLRPIAARYIEGEISWVQGTLCRPELCFELELIASREDH